MKMALSLLKDVASALPRSEAKWYHCGMQEETLERYRYKTVKKRLMDLLKPMLG